MRVIFNIVWPIRAGIWMAISSVIAGLLRCVAIIDTPSSPQVFKLASYGVWPIDWALVPRDIRSKGLFVVGNIPLTLTCTTRRSAGIEI
jgi:uncharacterized membrane protein YccF (DUF307 family)